MVDNSGLIGGGGVKAGDNYRELRVNLQKTADASKNISGNVTAPLSLKFSPDGTTMSIIQGSGSPQTLHSYSLSSAWDVTSASHNGSYNPSAQSTAPRGIAYNSDGTKVVVADGTLRTLFQYSIGTAYKLNTISGYDSVSFSIASEMGFTQSIAFGDSGNKLYAINNGGVIYQYNLSGAYDISTASYASKSLSMSSLIGSVFSNGDITFSSDGTKLFVIGGNIINDQAVEVTLGTAWDISTGTDSGFRIHGGSVDNDPHGIFLGDSGTKIYVAGDANNKIYQYNLDTANTLGKTILNLTSTKAIVTGLGLESANKQGLSSDISVNFAVQADGAASRKVGPIYSSANSSVSDALEGLVGYPYLNKVKNSINIKASYSNLNIDAVVFYNLL